MTTKIPTFKAPPYFDHRVTQVTRTLQKQPWLRLQQLSNIVSLSPSRLRHLFKEHTGMRIGEYAKEIQLKRVRALLIDSYRPLKDIGQSVGIRDTGNLVHHFRKRFGYTPGHYRRLYRNPR
jgi:AraC family transcriptional regulator, arabinose operon regulatory protein